MAIEQGKEYNPETAANLRERKFEFVTCNETFRYTLQIPEYVLARLDSEALDKLYSYMNDYATHVISVALKGGFAFSEEARKRMRADVGQHLKNYIWERFSISQERAGFDCWQVAPSLQKVQSL